VEKDNKMKIGYGILVVIVIVIYGILSFKKFLYVTGMNYEVIEHSTPVEFKERSQTIFISTRIFGLGSQHFHTIISDIDHVNNKIPINKEKEIILDGKCGFYYKIQDPDSLLIYMSSLSYSEERDTIMNIGLIKVKIHEFKVPMSSKYQNNYRDMGLLRINCYDGIE